MRPSHKGCVLTIGKFDGVHLGHQAVLKNVIEQARALSLPATVMVFEPQPEELFSPEKAPARLSTLRDKYRLLKDVGVDRLICVRFNREFASMSAQDFVKSLLVEQLGVKFLVVGDDFRFGHGRVGDFDFLVQAGAQYQFDVVSTQSFRVQDCRISSTEIRNLLDVGDIAQAQAMLGRPFTVSGRVVHGEKNGRTIGFPTANIMMKRYRTPLVGVFAIQAKIDGVFYKGVANIGKRPTLNGQKVQLEAHLFDFSGDLYGKLVDVMPTHKIRDERKFASLDDLKQQINLDAQTARSLLNS